MRCSFDKDYLLSTDNDKSNIHKKGYRSVKGGIYQILRYDKDVLSYDNYKQVGLYRSVVVNLVSKKLVSFSPNKSLNLSDITVNDMEHIRAEEFVEGTMINLFYDSEQGCWDIATRSTVGGNVKFYRNSSKTFAALFEETCVIAGLEIEDNLSKEYMYSFVIQHPENRIVCPISQPALYLTSVYKQREESIDGKQQIHIDAFDFNTDSLLTTELKTVKDYIVNNTKVKLPMVYVEACHTVQTYVDKYASANTSYDVMGVVFKDVRNGFQRYKARNPNYEDVRRMRGNQSKLQYTYLELRKNGKMTTYLKVYAEDKQRFSQYRSQIHTFTHGLYKNYIMCYIKKQAPLVEWPQQFRIHMFNIHQKYLNEYVQEKKHITFQDVVEYFNEMHPSQQMALLNYNFRTSKLGSNETEIAQER